MFLGLMNCSIGDKMKFRVCFCRCRVKLPTLIEIQKMLRLQASSPSSSYCKAGYFYYLTSCLYFRIETTKKEAAKVSSFRRIRHCPLRYHRRRRPYPRRRNCDKHHRRRSHDRRAISPSIRTDRERTKNAFVVRFHREPFLFHLLELCWTSHWIGLGVGSLCSWLLGRGNLMRIIDDVVGDDNLLAWSFCSFSTNFSGSSHFLLLSSGHI